MDIQPDAIALRRRPSSLRLFIIGNAFPMLSFVKPIDVGNMMEIYISKGEGVENGRIDQLQSLIETFCMYGRM